LKIEKKTFKE